jgi:outer membrane protein assembly factor BamD
MMRNSTILYISVVLVFLGACSGFDKIVKSSDYTLKYDEALRYYNKEDYYKAQTLYDQIAPVFRGSSKADTVYFYQAMSYFKQNDFIMAGYHFESFIRIYGGSPFAEEASYMTAYCYYLTSPRAELDQTATTKAIQSFRAFLMKYPASDKREEVLAYIDELIDKLVEKSYISARLYFDLEDYKASMVSLRTSLIEFPESKYREELLFMIFKASYKYAEKSVPIKRNERYQASLDDYFSFKAEYPESKFIREADKYYAIASSSLNGSIDENIELDLN